MLVLSRRLGQSICIGDRLEITVTGINDMEVEFALCELPPILPSPSKLPAHGREEPLPLGLTANTEA